jgi:hypothetical protein
VQAEDVGLPFLDRTVPLLERRANRSLSVDRVLDAEAVRDSWNIVFSKNALKLRNASWSLSMSSCAIGIRILSNFAWITFLSWSRRVPFLS